ncbi:hypothetical protein ABVT39_025428, partial [Epinephelus coioides]
TQHTVKLKGKQCKQCYSFAVIFFPVTEKVRPGRAASQQLRVTGNFIWMRTSELKSESHCRWVQYVKDCTSDSIIIMVIHNRWLWRNRKREAEQREMQSE